MTEIRLQERIGDVDTSDPTRPYSAEEQIIIASYMFGQDSFDEDGHPMQIILPIFDRSLSPEHPDRPRLRVRSKKTGSMNSTLEGVTIAKDTPSGPLLTDGSTENGFLAEVASAILASGLKSLEASMGAQLARNQRRDRLTLLHLYAAAGHLVGSGLHLLTKLSDEESDAMTRVFAYRIASPTINDFSARKEYYDFMNDVRISISTYTTSQ
jgi:hypothetical protein